MRICFENQLIAYFAKTNNKAVKTNIFNSEIYLNNNIK